MEPKWHQKTEKGTKGEPKVAKGRQKAAKKHPKKHAKKKAKKVADMATESPERWPILRNAGGQHGKAK